MNSCCTLPVEQIAADEHKPGGECCLITEKTEAPPRADCPVSGTSSRKVQHGTVEHLVKPESAPNITAGQYYYCAEAGCPVVYFAQDGIPSFTTADIKVPVFSKDPGGDVNACYCFEWTRNRIRNELSQTGICTAATEIAKKVKAQLCECDIKNPKGTCCLGDVNAVVKEAMQALSP